MLNLFRRHRPHPTIERLYGAIVAQARQPAFYTAFEVPDTIEGRLELLILHTFLVCHRLKGESDLGRNVSQEVFDAFLDDMDRTLRQMGVGDLSVPKRMKKIGAAFYGRTAAYDRALEEGPAALATALARNVYECDPGSEAPRRLALYVEAARHRLGGLELPQMLTGDGLFPDPAGGGAHD